MPADRLLTIDELAYFLGVPVKTIYQWRYKGTGPTGLRVGRHVRYRQIDVDRWLDGLVEERAVPPRAGGPEESYRRRW
jgi:excisionase family DNA binding protein